MIYMSKTLKIKIGAQFGKWTVLSFISKKEAKEVNYKGGAAYLCQCSCDKQTKRYKSSTSLLRGSSTSCGCERWANAKAKSLAKYGVESAAQRPEIQAKRKETNLSRYGSDNPFGNSDLMKPHRGKTQTKAARDKRIKTNIDRYGVPSLLCKDSPKRVNFKQTKESITKTLETKKINKKGVNLLPNGMIVSEYCATYGVKTQHANSIYRCMGPEACKIYIESKNTDTRSFLERNMEEILKPDLSISFYNKNMEVGGKTHRPDFIINDDLHLNTDGIIWHSDKYKKPRYHFEKRECYEKEGKQLLQFRSDEIFCKPDIVKSIVLHKSGLSKNKLFARKLTIKEIKFGEVAEFLKTTHLMGTGAPGKSVVLKDGDNIVAAFIYKINKDNSMEVLRYSTALNTSVIGGFSKLLKHVTRSNSNIKSVISFVDLRYGNGKSLEKIGFTRSSVSLGWSWVDKFSKTQNRLRVRAGNGKTESEHASELGWAKIYDAGQAKYTLIL